MTVRDRLNTLPSQAADLSRKALHKAAETVAVLPGTTRDALATSRKAGKVAVAAARTLTDAQLDTFEVLAAHGAKRLETASQANTWDTLVSGQMALNAEAKEVALAESRKYLEMYFDAKGRWDEAVKARVMGLVTPKAKPRKVAQPAEKAA